MGDATLDAIHDERAIVALTVDYAWAIDEHRYDALRSVFTPDAVAILGERCEGIDAIIARIDRALTRLDTSQHIVANHQVRVSDEGLAASCRCYFHAQHVLRGTPGGDTFIVAGIYADDLVRTDEGWRIAHRVLTVQWTSGNPAVNQR